MWQRGLEFKVDAEVRVPPSSCSPCRYGRVSRSELVAAITMQVQVAVVGARTAGIRLSDAAAAHAMHAEIRTRNSEPGVGADSR
jgi:hypothetical protein